MTPVTLDGSGAVFRITLTTHTGSVDLDPAAAAQLRVDGAPSDDATWDGPGPGGHHREGTLRFATSIPSGAAVELRITDSPSEATGTWTAP